MAYVAFPENPNFSISPPPPPLVSAQPSPSRHPPEISSSSSSDPLFDPLSASFHPSVAIVVGVLITMFSLTFLLLLYVKLCKRHRMAEDSHGIISADPDARFFPLTSPTYHRTLTIALTTQARNSGVDKSVVETLPTFAFASLQGFKDGLECAVCLCVFESADILRLLPKCKHAFHVDCVGTWLHNHSTCPLCRSRVEADDVLEVGEFLLEGKFSSEAATIHVGRLSSSSNVDQIAADMGAPLQLYIQRGGSDANMQWCNPSDSINGSGSRRKGGEVRRDLAALDQMDGQQIAMRFGHRIIVCSDALLPPRWSNFTPSDTMLLNPQTYRGYTEIKKQSPAFTASRDPSSGHPLNASRTHESGEARAQISHGESSETIRVLGVRNPSSYIRSVSEVTGMRRFMESYKKPEDADAMATRWFAIAKRTINQWL